MRPGGPDSGPSSGTGHSSGAGYSSSTGPGSGTGTSSGTGHSGGERAVPYVCPFCGEDDLRPADAGRWHCRACLRLFSLTFHGVVAPASPYGGPGSATPAPTPARGVRLSATPDDARADALTLDDDDPPTPGSTR